MWQYNNVTFRFSNPVDSVHGQVSTIPYLTTYKKSKFALMQALERHVENSFLGPYAEIDQRSVRHDTPFKV